MVVSNSIYPEDDGSLYFSGKACSCMDANYLTKNELSPAFDVPLKKGIAESGGGKVLSL